MTEYDDVQDDSENQHDDAIYFIYGETGGIILYLLFGLSFFMTIICCCTNISTCKKNSTRNIDNTNNTNNTNNANNTNNDEEINEEIIENSIKYNIIQKLHQYSLLIFSKNYDKFEECSICYETFQDTNIRILPCFHKFHVKCIDTWLLEENKLTCPLCTNPIDMENTSNFIQECEKDLCKHIDIYNINNDTNTNTTEL